MAIPDSASLSLAEQADSDEYDKNKVCTVGNRNLLRLTSFPRGRTEQCCEPDSASLSLAEQADSDEYDKNKVCTVADLVFMAPATGIEPVTNP